MRRGTELAIAEVNEQGGIGGRPLQLLQRDPESKTALYVEHAESLIRIRPGSRVNPGPVRC